MNKLIDKTFSSESATESISIAEVKEHLFIDSSNTTFDNDLTRLIKQVREWVEETTCLSLIGRTVTVYINYFSPFTLPYSPMVTFSTASIKTGIATYEDQVIDDEFEIEVGRFTSYVGGGRWKLIYTAGYTTSTIPYGLKLAVLNEIAKRFEHRGDNVIVDDTNILIQPYKLLEWLM
jgi:hypothetical protein